MWSETRRRAWLPWIVWGGLTAAVGLYLAQSLFSGGAGRQVFLPGATTDGHYQIELECERCHQSAFTKRDEMQQACESCHAEELRLVKDSHPKAKFTDPRNAHRVAELDARYCVTCHGEHRPAATLGMGLTLPLDYCFKCHADVGKERPSHRDFAFDGCAASGCHNYHDNRALYEDFLVKRAAEPDVLSDARALLPSSGPGTRAALGTGDQDGRGHALAPEELAAWARSEHGRAGINCSGCHGTEAGGFVAQVSEERCGRCHSSQMTTWKTGKHGMRRAQGMSALDPGEARREMHGDSHGRLLGCNTCHAAHDYPRQMAAADACLGCHADEHSQAYPGSPHAELWRKELVGAGAPGSGVSCATCHMPREPSEDGRVATQHNQNSTLRPSEKMIRSVCSSCHGLRFSLDALADAKLVKRNFTGKPSAHVASIDMARRRTMNGNAR